MTDTKKYTVKEFVKKYNTAKSDEVKEILVKSVMNPQYVDYEKKITICEKIVEASYYKKDKNGNKKLHIDSPSQYMGYCLWLVKEYTNIEINFKNSLEEFNLLNKNGLFDAVISFIPERELKEFRMILDMVENDAIQNKYETHAFIANQVERFGELAGVSLKPAIEQLATTLENMDEKTVEKMIQKLKVFSGAGLKGKINLIK